MALWLFVALLPGLIAWPLVQAIWMSFRNVIGPRWGTFVAMRNPAQQLQDPLSSSHSV